MLEDVMSQHAFLLKNCLHSDSDSAVAIMFVPPPNRIADYMTGMPQIIRGLCNALAK